MHLQGKVFAVDVVLGWRVEVVLQQRILLAEDDRGSVEEYLHGRAKVGELG